MYTNRLKSLPFILSIPLLMAFSFFVMLSFNVRAAGNTIHVNRAVSGGNNDGSSWANAYSDLQAALAAAVPSDEIWVATGVYTPGNTVSHTFQLTDGVAIYGGFGATETVRSQRDWNQKVTVLSGDIDGDDIADANGVVVTATHIVGSNNYHVVTGSGVTNTAVLDGFTITAGQANGANTPHNGGGGMYNFSGSPTLYNVTFSGNSALLGGGGMSNNNSNCPQLINMTFSNNIAIHFEGGGMSNFRSSPQLSNVTFYGNRATDFGGGMSNFSSSPQLSNVTFFSNGAYIGGGMSNYNGRPQLSNVIFSGNHAHESGGGMSNFRSSPQLSNVTLYGNYAHESGGGMFNDESSPELSNVTFSGNWAHTGGGMFNSNDSNPTLVNTIMWGNRGMFLRDIHSNSSNPVISYSLIEGSGGSGADWNSIFFGMDGGNNIDSDPRFVQPVTYS